MSDDFRDRLSEQSNQARLDKLKRNARLNGLQLGRVTGQELSPGGIASDRPVEMRGGAIGREVDAWHRTVRGRKRKRFLVAESFKLLSSWVVRGTRQFWVGGNFFPVKILEIPSTQLVQEALLTNTGTDPTDWVVGIKTIKPTPTPGKQQIYTIYGDGRTTDYLESVEVRYLYYAGDGLWVSEPTAPEYDFYAQPIPQDPPVDQQRWDFGWRGFYTVAGDYYFDDGFASGVPPSASTELIFDPVTCDFNLNSPRAEEFEPGWYSASENTLRPYVYHASTSTEYFYRNPILNFNYSYTVPSVSGFPSNPVLYQFSGTNQRTKNISSVANYSSFWGANPSPTYYDDTQPNGLAIVPGYPVTSPEFNSTIIQATQINQISQYPSWSFYDGQLNFNQGSTNVNVTKEYRSTINAPSVNWENRTNLPYGLTSPDVYTGYSSLSPGRVNTVRNSDSGNRNYNGEAWISPTVKKDFFTRIELNEETINTQTDVIIDSSVNFIQRQSSGQTIRLTKNWVSRPAVTHYRGEISVLSWQMYDNRNNSSAQNVFKKILFFENNEIEINAEFGGANSDPSYVFAFLRYHSAQWVDRSTYYWVEMPEEMGVGVDDVPFWDESEFPQHTIFAHHVLTNGKEWLPKEYKFDSSDNKFKKAEDFSAISSETFPVPQNATEQRIYDVRYVRD